MIRSHQKDLRFKAEITVFVSLIFMLMLSLIGALLSSAALYIRKSEVRGKMELALESAFAEYDRDMLEKYDLFVRSDCDEVVLTSRLKHYGVQDVEQKILKSQLLTDNDGLPFYQEAIRYMKDWAGIEEDFDYGDTENFLPDLSLEALERETQEELKNATLSEEENPLTYIQNLKNTNLLSNLVIKNQEISSKTIELENIPSKRNLSEGIGVFEKETEEGGIIEKSFFIAYLLEHFTCKVSEKSEGSLSYELEYLLCGKGSDKENLEGTLQKILRLRMGVNYAYLLTDEGKLADVKALATLICTISSTPELVTVVKQALLLTWAYGESLMDLRMLMRQDRVPTIKTKESWKLQLSNLIKLGDHLEAEENNEEGGLGYWDYLKGLLLLESRENLCMRSLDLIEENLSVQVDKCMTKVIVESNHRLREGVHDTFETKFEYN